jgi:hypothetical protein
MTLPFEDSIEMGSAVVLSDRAADAIAVLGHDPILRDTADRLMTIKAVFGDHEAFLADTATDIIANLQILAATWAKHPERVLSSVIRAMSTKESKQTAIDRIRETLTVLESELATTDTEAATEEVPYPVMLTGGREITNPGPIGKAMSRVLTEFKKLHPGTVAISGGAEGADQLWAWAAIDTETPFTLVLPNWAYGYNYGQQGSIEKLAENPLCLGMIYAVDRPIFEDLAHMSQLWRSEKWWTDNFVRNEVMITSAQQHVICHQTHPRTMLTNRNLKGGTAHAVRAMQRLEVKEAVFISTEHPDDIVWVPLQQN